MASAALALRVSRISDSRASRLQILLEELDVVAVPQMAGADHNHGIGALILEEHVPCPDAATDAQQHLLGIRLEMCVGSSIAQLGKNALQRRGWRVLTAEVRQLSNGLSIGVLPENGVHRVQGIVDVVGGDAVVGDESPRTRGGIASLDTSLLQLAAQDIGRAAVTWK